MPSPSRSPSASTAEPKRPPGGSTAPSPPDRFESLVSPTSWPAASREITITAPQSLPPSSSRGTPTATSTLPSPSRSPSVATDMPKRSSATRSSARSVSSISLWPTSVPSAAISSTCTAPEWASKPTLPSSPSAPTIRSTTPLPSRSPSTSRSWPKSSLSCSTVSSRPTPSPTMTTRSTSPGTVWAVPGAAAVKVAATPSAQDRMTDDGRERVRTMGLLLLEQGADVAPGAPSPG